MKTILITGCSPKGIGEACAKLFSSKNWSVIAALRDPKKNPELASLSNVQIVKLDITKYEEMKQTIEDIQSKYNIDVLLNNAGYGMKSPLEQSENEDNRNLYETNVFGTINITNLFVPYFKKKKNGTIITMSSTAGIIAMPLDGIYGSSKRAITSINESLYYELKPYNVKIKIIFPGVTETNFKIQPYVEGEYQHIQENQEEYESCGEKDLLGPEECANAVYEAATDEKDQLHYYGDHISKKLIQQYYSMGIEKFKNYFFDLLFKPKSNEKVSEKMEQDIFNYKKVAQEIGWDFSKINPFLEKKHNYDYYKKVSENINENTVMLDIGCGSGHLSIPIYSKAKKIYALDNEEEMIKKYKENLEKFLSEKEKEKFEVINFDCQQIFNFPDESFDLVVSRHCGGNMKEVFRVLKKGGVFISEDISKYDCQELKEVFNRGQEYFEEPIYKKTMNEIVDIGFSNVNFEKFEEIEYYNKLEELLFLLTHTPILDFYDLEKDKIKLNEYIEKYSTEKGIPLFRRLYSFYLIK